MISSLHFNKRFVHAESVGQIHFQVLTEQQKKLRVEIMYNMLDCANNYLEFTKAIIIGDETWVYGYNPKSKF